MLLAVLIFLSLWFLLTLPLLILLAIRTRRERRDSLQMTLRQWDIPRAQLKMSMLVIPNTVWTSVDSRHYLTRLRSLIEDSLLKDGERYGLTPTSSKLSITESPTGSIWNRWLHS